MWSISYGLRPRKKDKDGAGDKLRQIDIGGIFSGGVVAPQGWINDRY